MEIHTSGLLVMVLIGIVLALAFQLLLTVLSVALGITAVGDLKSQFVSKKYHSVGNVEDEKDEFSTSLSTKMISGLGFWNLITVSLSLGLGCFLALSLSPSEQTLHNIVIALIIWAIFYVLMFYLEGKMIGTLVGGLLSIVFGGIKASADAVKSMFTGSTANARNDAEVSIGKLKAEYDTEFDPTEITGSIDKYINRLDNKVPDYRKLERDVEDLYSKVDTLTTKKGLGDNAAKWLILQTVLRKVISNVAVSKVEPIVQLQLSELLDKAQDMYDEAEDTGTDSDSGSEKLTYVDPEYTDSLDLRIRSALTEETLNNWTNGDWKEGIRAIVDDPAKDTDEVIARFKALNKRQLQAIISENTVVSKSKLDTYIEDIQNFIQPYKEKAITAIGFNLSEFTKQIESRVANFIDTTDAPELNYALLKSDVQRAIASPADSLDIAKKRLETFNVDTMVSLITNTGVVSRDQIANVKQAIEDARTDMQMQLDRLESRVRGGISNLERKAVLQAESTRKAALLAAWWLVGLIISSGVSAIIAATLV